MTYSQEWFQIKLAKIWDMMHNDLRYTKSEAEVDVILREVAIHLHDVKQAVYEITDLMTENETGELVVNRLLNNEYQLQMFFRRYDVLSECVRKCKHMSADV